MKSKLLVTGAVLALSIGLTACGGDNDGPEQSAERFGSNAMPKDSPNSVVTTESDEDDAASDEEPTESASESESPSATDQPITFGQTMAWDTGLSVTVSAPQPFQPSEYTDPGSAPHNVKLRVKIVNQSDAMFDPAMFTTTLQSGDAEAEEIFDSEKDINGGPSTKLLPGREVVFAIAYNVKDPKDLVLEVRPDFALDSAFFVS